MFDCFRFTRHPAATGTTIYFSFAADYYSVSSRLLTPGLEIAQALGAFAGPDSSQTLRYLNTTSTL
jgi:hypothetical protein